MGSLYFLQGIFLTQGSNPGLLHCRQILYQLSHQGSPWYRDKSARIQDRLVRLWLLISNTEMRFPLPQKIVVHLSMDRVCQESVNYSLLPVIFFFFLFHFHWHSATPFHICMVYICFHSNSRVESLQHGPQGRKDLPTLMAFVKYKIL